jgi:cell division protein FtsX
MDAIKNIRRTPFQSISMFMIQFFSAFLLLVSVSSTILLVAIFNKIETQIPINVYFETTADEKIILDLREQLLSSGKTSSVQYWDKKKAYEFYKNQNQNNPLLLEMTSEENFPPSLEIQARRPDHLFEIAEFFEDKEGVDEVQFEKKTVQRLVTVTNVLRTSILILAGYLAIMSIVTLMTIVMFKIALRKDEIELQKLLGATNGNITKPFFNEGNIITIFSATAASCVFLAALFIAKDMISSYLFGINDLNIITNNIIIKVWPVDLQTIATLVFGIFAYIFLINTLSTKIATSKYIG